MKKIKAKKTAKPAKQPAKAKAAHPVPVKQVKDKLSAEADDDQSDARPAQTPEPPAAPAEPKKIKFSKEDSAKFRKLLVELRDHLIDGVNFLANENLKRSAREASGELSGYSTHMADAGTDNFDREFALSLVSNEQEALYEIEEALKRMDGGTFGVCEVCEKPIRRERLEAVPFARLCVQCQSTFEKDRRRPMQTTAVFSENADDEGGEAEDSEE